MQFTCSLYVYTMISVVKPENHVDGASWWVVHVLLPQVASVTELQFCSLINLLLNLSKNEKVMECRKFCSKNVSREKDWVEFLICPVDTVISWALNLFFWCLGCEGTWCLRHSTKLSPQCVVLVAQGCWWSSCTPFLLDIQAQGDVASDHIRFTDRSKISKLMATKIGKSDQ